MNSKFLLLTLCALFFVFGCAGQVPQQGVPEAVRSSTGSDVGVMDGALIVHEIQEPEMVADSFDEKNEMVIVQCPACSQRVDVTGLPRDRIRCPNCSSLFTY